jgi:predicted DNA-binding WGR domain protein
MPLFWIKNNRYYKIIFQPTLFGTIDVICTWGRIGGNLGNYKVVSSKDEQDIASIVDAVKKRRKQRGYRLCS